ncbi:RagB/SusD family nutrient uptake outer membrane protein [Chitinophaga rhizophila]|uniref:RagB/SusD family nutrient uptake outer membrane protein n=1 Tax=Chitinophaga rhizophila TaxID=2866212 RepID=A0ABS7GES4_9BACT|nr:RagB/SusD family nutrient uptake outer membrane protein [Chitinophaga rhizophila]MBW8685319.1 RagB/SusD family nutrient uptake outer membrane protein [Chitinophaga rhizophila]
MKTNFNRYSCSLLAGILLLTAAGCKKEYADPSGPSYDQVISSPNALADITVGLQNWYTANRTSILYTSIATASLLTGETYVVNAGNADEGQLFAGGASLQNTNAVVTGMWAVSNKVVFDANRTLNSVDAVVSDANYAAGIKAYASIFKALAIGNMSMFWTHVPDTIGVNVPFITSQEGYRKAVRVIDGALGVLAKDTISAAFRTSIPAGVNILNTLYALKARYALFGGLYDTALAAANKVAPAAPVSVFSYNTTFTNPIFTLVTATNNIYQVIDSSMGLPAGLRPDDADQRFPFYVGILSNPKFRVKGFFNALTQSIPVYLPGELTLIKAECYARKGEVANGLTALNQIVTKQPAADPLGVGAGLPPVDAGTADELLPLIYKHRRIELFMSGMELEDQRRFDRPVAERKRTWLPFPFVERNDNTNIPEDPAF